jgi:hypothetical protein
VPGHDFYILALRKVRIRRTFVAEISSTQKTKREKPRKIFSGSGSGTIERFSHKFGRFTYIKCARASTLAVRLQNGNSKGSVLTRSRLPGRTGVRPLRAGISSPKKLGAGEKWSGWVTANSIQPLTLIRHDQFGAIGSAFIRTCLDLKHSSCSATFGCVRLLSGAR